MAFGKQPENLGKVTSFRQMGNAWKQNQADKKQGGGAGGSRAPTWVNSYKPPTDDTDLIRILAGNYTVEDSDRQGNLLTMNDLPFFPFIEHYDSRTKKTSVCSAGPFSNHKDKRKPCKGCDLFFSSMKINEKTGKKERGFMSRREMVAFTIIHLHNYHKIPQLQNNGAPKLNPNTGAPYMSWVKCSKSMDGRGRCKHCDAGVEKKYGHRMHWPMGQDHYNTLLARDEDIGQCCSNCQGRDTIVQRAWLCQHCQDAVIDMDTTELLKKEVDEMVTHPVTCPHCKKEDMLMELIDCKNCSSPKRASLFDVDLKVRRLEDAGGTNRTTLSISGFSDPHPIDAVLAEMAKPERLDIIYAPTPFEVQAGLFGDAPIRQPVTASDASKPYSNHGE